MDLNPKLWHGKRVLVTGQTGFKGSWKTSLSPAEAVNQTVDWYLRFSKGTKAENLALEEIRKYKANKW